MNKFIKDEHCQKRMNFLRSRPYKKNDQCYVEQKNYTNVRTLFGYGRIDWKNAVSMMNNIYRGHWRLLQNFYCPQQKLISKQRFGSKVVRKMSEPKTPFERLCLQMDPQSLTALEAQKSLINPIESLKKVKCTVIPFM
jgi:hypothetical protein